MRIAGAQIPVTNNIKNNVSQILTALEWAADNKVDFILFPEGALSGYLRPFRDIFEEDIEFHLSNVVRAATSAGVSIGLPTLYIQPVDFGLVKQSQIKYYNDAGQATGTYSKQMVIPADECYPGQSSVITQFEGINVNGRYNFSVGSFICNDLWGELNQKVIANENLQHYADNKVDFICHSTNGFRAEKAGDEIGNQKIKEYGDIHLWMAARYGVPILTVDNCNTIDGKVYSGTTSSTSGVIYRGEWLVTANDNGLNYFYYDLEV